VVIYLKLGDQKLVLGTLRRDKIAQISLDVVMEKEFVLSHNSKAASVHFVGYKVSYDDEGETLKFVMQLFLRLDCVGCLNIVVLSVLNRW
jgi:hypothetical protein